MKKLTSKLNPMESYSLGSLVKGGHTYTHEQTKKANPPKKKEDSEPEKHDHLNDD